MVSDFTRRLQSSAANLASLARGFWRHVGEVALGTLGLAALVPEALSVWEMTDPYLRDAEGQLATGAFATLFVTTVISCGVTLVLFHVPFRHVFNRVRSKWLSIVALAIVSAVILAPQFLNVTRDLPMGNSLDIAPGQVAALKAQMLLYGGLVRALFILLCTIAASIGLTLIHRGWHKAVAASRAARDARTLQEAITLIDDGYQEALGLRAAAAEHNRNLAVQFARAVSEGLEDQARSIIRYLNGRPSGFPNAEQLFQDLQSQFKPPFTVTDKHVAERVELRLEEHRVEFSLLPDAAEKLSATGRAALADLADWLREQANFDAIFNETVMNTEPSHV